MPEIEGHQCPRCGFMASTKAAEPRFLFTTIVATHMQGMVDGPPRIEASYLRHHPRARLGDKEWRLIHARLKEGWSADELIKAIDGCHKSPFHCGKNDRGTKYQSLALILRDSSHVQSFIAINDSPPVPEAKTPDDVQERFLRRFGR